MSVSIAVVIPTRNRADLAIAAIRSLQGQNVDLDVYVSDNSTTPEPLRAYCAKEPRVTYLRPASELRMPAHWDWALAEAQKRSSATHFTVHYDRRVSKPRHWGAVAAVAARHRGAVITYTADNISHWPPPLRIWQSAWTGRLFEIESAAAAARITSGDFNAVAHAVPILSNCLVPRAILDAMRERFGDVCNSTTPDAAFASRFLAVCDRYLHHDVSIGIVYGSKRSNGIGFLRGEGGDFSDFRESFRDRSWLAASPLPGVNLGQNMLYHEYELVRAVSGDRLPPLDRRAVIDDLAQAVGWVADDSERAAFLDLMRREGWTGEEPNFAPRAPLRVRLQQAYCRFRMWMGAVPPTVCGLPFRNDRSALRACLRHPRSPETNAGHLALLSPVEIT